MRPIRIEYLEKPLGIFLQDKIIRAENLAEIASEVECKLRVVIAQIRPVRVGAVDEPELSLCRMARHGAGISQAGEVDLVQARFKVHDLIKDSPMAERDMAAALSASLHAEEDSIAQRIARAEQMLGGGQDGVCPGSAIIDNY